MTEREWNGPRAQSLLWPGVTVEMALYAAIGAAALALRLAALGRWPLLEGEARTALAAWRALQGQAVDGAGVQPLIYNLSWLLFGLTAASDAILRLLPALAGAALAVAPYWARDLLGRVGALVAALLLCLAPTWVTYSRLAASPILTAAASAALLLGVWRVLRGEHRPAVRLLAVALGLGPVAGAGFYTTVLAAAIFGGLWWRRADENTRQQLRRVWAGATLRQNLLLAGGLLLFSASGLLLNPAGIGMAVQEAARWAGSLWPGAGGLPAWHYGRLLLAYEPLTLALAAIAAWRAARERRAMDGFLLLWAALALLLGSLGGHRGPEWLADALLPLVALAGRGAQWLWDHLAAEREPTDVAALAMGLVIVAIGGVGLAGYARNETDVYLGLAVLCLGLLIVSLVGYGLWAGRTAVARVGAALLTLLLAAIMLHSTAALTTATGRDPRELLVGATVSPEVGQLAAELPALSARLTGNPRDLEVAYEAGLDPWLGWYLRGLNNAHVVETAGPAPTAAVLITSGCGVTSPAGYVGRCYRLTQEPPAESAGAERLRWLLFRSPAQESEGRRMTLWERLPEGAQ